MSVTDSAHTQTGNCRFPNWLAKEITAVAKQKAISRNAVILIACAEFIERHKAETKGA